jgi:hypothetical protein
MNGYNVRTCALHEATLVTIVCRNYEKPRKMSVTAAGNTAEVRHAYIWNANLERCSHSSLALQRSKVKSRDQNPIFTPKPMIRTAEILLYFPQRFDCQKLVEQILRTRVSGTEHSIAISSTNLPLITLSTKRTGRECKLYSHSSFISKCLTTKLARR